jgi:hypothetical protein
MNIKHIRDDNKLNIVHKRQGRTYGNSPKKPSLAKA